MRRSRVLIAALVVVAGGFSGAEGATAKTWYVSAAAAPGGNGSVRAPFDALADVERASRAGDTIIVLPASVPLDGGIALKHGQHLVGAGPPVVRSTKRVRPRITNTSAKHIDGDGVRLSDGAEVRNLVVANTYRGGIYGIDVTGVRVRGNYVSKHNTSCTVGFEVFPIIAPTNAPFVGVPFGIELPAIGRVYAIYIPNGWAGIMVDATRATGRIAIERNVVHDADCGDGIDLRLSGTADLVARIADNTVTHLRQGDFGQAHPGLVQANSLMAIGLQTDDTARLVVDEIGNTQTYIGGPDSDCEGLFFDVSGASTMIANVDRNRFAHGIGGTSCNGMELITGVENATADVRVANSTFEDNPGDMIEAGTLGRGSKMRLSLDNVLVRKTTIRGGNDGAIPFNIGECLIGGNSAADGAFSLRVRNSEFTGCNNGIMVASNVAAGNGVGEATSLSVDIASSRIHHNAFYNLWIQNATPLRSLSVRVASTDLSNAGGTGVAIDQRYAGVTLSSSIDLSGANCLFGSGEYDASTTAYLVNARNDWWGRAAGPASSQTSASPPMVAAIDASRPLARAPAICS
jgi:hypothetical protein